MKLWSTSTEGACHLAARTFTASTAEPQVNGRCLLVGAAFPWTSVGPENVKYLTQELLRTRLSSCAESEQLETEKRSNVHRCVPGLSFPGVVGEPTVFLGSAPELEKLNRWFQLQLSKTSILTESQHVRVLLCLST